MTAFLIRFVRRLYHYGVYLAGGAVIVMCLAALFFRFWVMPNIAGYEGALEAAASQAVGQPVAIGGLAADWHGVNPRVVLRDVRMTPPSGPPLTLPRVEAVVSWLSLPLLEPRLASLNLERVSLALRRDARGVITVAGIPVNVPGAPSPFPDWLLKQPRIVVRDAELTWLDETLAAPELRLSQVRLLVENGFGRHRFGGVAHPTGTAARRLELRGDFRGDSVHALSEWSGEAYARVDDARLENWGRWVPWAQQAVKGGTGSLRFWLKLKQGQVRDLVGDARLNQVALSLQRGLPNLCFDNLFGRVGWSRRQESQDFFVERLRFQQAGGAPAEPASVRVSLVPDGQGGFKRIGVKASNLRLETLTALTGAIPLPRRGHDLIAALNPRGLVESAEGHWAGLADYTVKLRLREAGVAAYAALPGVSGLTARIQADAKGGEASLEGRGLMLNWNRLFRHDLGFSRLDAEARWQVAEDAVTVAFEAGRIANDDLEGTAEGRVELPKAGAPRVDIRGHLSHGEARAVHRYLPRPVGDQAYEWLRRGLQGGHSDDVRLTLKGDLSRFPFDHGGGEFKVAINMVDGVLDYAEGWPRIEQVRGSLVFQDKTMLLEAHAGRILDAELGPVKVVIPDLHYSYDEVVLVDGRARGDTQTFLEFIRQSPVNDYTNGFTAPFQAEGKGELALKLRIPVRLPETTTVSGNYALQGNRLVLGGELPQLTDVLGVVGFTEKGLQARGVRLSLLGQPAVFDLADEAPPGGGSKQVRVKASGRLEAEALKPYLPASMAGRVRGATTWQADVGMNAERAVQLSLTSDLVGMAVDLPHPLGKSAAQTLNLALSSRPGGPGGDQLAARLGDLVTLRAEVGGGRAPRVNIKLGGEEAPPPGAEGLWISGNLRLFDLDAWLALSRDLPGAGTGAGEALFKEASVSFNELRAFNHRLRDTHVRFRQAGQGWQANLAGREVAGEVNLVPDREAFRVLANFKRLTFPEALPGSAPAPEGLAKPASLRSLELNAGNLSWKGLDLGEARLRLSSAQHGFQIDSFILALADSKVEAKGLLAEHPRRPSRVEFQVESGSLGKLLAQLGQPGRLRGAPAQVSGTLTWQGGLDGFDLSSLGGSLDVAVKPGQFLKVEPGAARLLGILSLQSLPRRITLDFRDVFSEGFAFDEIVGSLHLDRGLAYAKDLRMNGPAAKIRLSGVVDLAKESQNLRVVIQPRLDDSVAVAGALIGGPVVGLGTLIAGKVLKDPLGQAVTFEYAVTGNWSDPVVAKVPRGVRKEAESP